MAGPLIRRRPLVAALAGAGVFGLCAFVAATGASPAPERDVFWWINGLPHALTAPRTLPST